ncbi:DUF3310 domain-containing protein [Streptomyces roseolus]|uniref:DUF3310 domain-containing protein n=1 Tax=Streptomyces roseolus TaxID=67358 RepID=UPI00167863D8|nr:DUF3310 domain-containing protein [Streptomyces roseolus]GGR51446.1 hypothetical protein GCM10010282_50440 [Streptomyces roseolus]
MTRKMVGDGIGRSAATGGLSHAGVHDWNGFCEMEPRCFEYDERVAYAPKLQSPPSTYDPPPSHYGTDKGIDPWAVWEAFELDPWEAALTKYILRSGKKDGESKLKDLKKARNYLAYLIEREEKRDG